MNAKVRINATGEIATVIDTVRIGNAVFYHYSVRVLVNGEERTYRAGQVTAL